MNNDVRIKVSLIILAAAFSWAVPSSLSGQHDFREFDRRMVVTPAELFDALSTLQPSELRQQMEAQRRSELEEAGREFLSKLSPEQKDKAWEFAEKYLRKNGVDAASSQKLMEQFGLPMELQNEISEQFRKYSNSSPDSAPRQKRQAEDAISEILNKARDQFNSGSNLDTRNEDDIARPKPEGSATPEVNGDEGNAPKPKPDPTARTGSKADVSNPKAENVRDRKRRNRKTELESKSQKSNRKRSDKASEDKTQGNTRTPWKPPAPRATDTDRRNKKRQSKRIPKDPRKNSGATEADLDRLLGQLEGLRKNSNGQNRNPNADPKSENSPTGDNLDWEKVIQELAEKGKTNAGATASASADTNSTSNSKGIGTLGAADLERAKKMLDEMTSNDRIDRDKLKRAQEVISRSIESQKRSDSGSGGNSPGTPSAAVEKIGTRFDRLLVKAAERTLSSQNDDSGVSNRVGSVFGSLIERIQKQATKKEGEREGLANRDANRRPDAANSDQPSSNWNRSSSERDGGNSRSNSTDNSRANDPIRPVMPKPSSDSIDPMKVLDGLPDLSGINPTHVFTFFAVVGCLLFVGYFLSQSVVGNGASVSRRKVVKQIRNTTIRSPKDLVETVDMFLLAKFGVKSSWWNAGIVQTVLKSGSPELKANVDELIQNYVRARYMREGIQIPTADQQRFKKTLEQLSLLNIKPVPNSKSVTALGSPSPAQG